jgi:hypothetical protein
MRRIPLFSWCAFLLWGLWLLAFQGALASGNGLAGWTPDLGLVLLIAVDRRLSRRHARVAALLLAVARAAVSADPPLALFAGYLGVVGLTGVLRAWLEIDRPLGRALVAALCAAGLALFWTLARAALVPGTSLPPPQLVPSVLATAVAAVLLVPLLRRLPGLSGMARVRA